MSEVDALRGAYCPLVVPFRDGKIDFDCYGKLIERQIAEGTHGFWSMPRAASQRC
jgi:4-hydroxy-tetrahydrodipicolinate synthase